MQVQTSEEHERPAEWLGSLVGRGQYRLFVDEVGSLPVAAYRLARALCRIRPVTMAVPTLRELSVAARTLSEACGLAVPPAATLLDACAQAGLLVIEPMVSAPRAARA